eukprot:3411854-Pleurochrysis_carterae.AAC.3
MQALGCSQSSCFSAFPLQNGSTVPRVRLACRLPASLDSTATTSGAPRGLATPVHSRSMLLLRPLAVADVQTTVCTKRAKFERIYRRYVERIGFIKCRTTFVMRGNFALQSHHAPVLPARRLCDSSMARIWVEVCFSVLFVFVCGARRLKTHGERIHVLEEEMVTKVIGATLPSGAGSRRVWPHWRLLPVLCSYVFRFACGAGWRRLVSSGQAASVRWVTSCSLLNIASWCSRVCRGHFAGSVSRFASIVLEPALWTCTPPNFDFTSMCWLCAFRRA